MKLSLFADDILLFLTNPEVSLPTLMQMLDSFNKLSGFKVNYDESEILTLSNIPQGKWQENTPFAIADTHIRYLGILIGKQLTSIYRLNIPLIIDKMRKELQT